MIPTCTHGKATRPPLPRWLQWLLAFLLVMPLASHAQVNEGLVPDSTELRVLRQYYATRGGDQWTNRTNWKQGTTLADVATWYGVTVAEGDVIRLALPTNNLHPYKAAPGRLLGKLLGLQQLDLSGNELESDLLLSLQGLPRLAELRLSNCTVRSNSTPGLSVKFAILSTCPNLRVLQLHDTYLGYINDFSNANLRKMPQLEVVDLGNEGQTGTIITSGLPTELVNCHALREVNLQWTFIGGDFPAGIGRLTHLQVLNLSHADIGGTLPDSLSYCQELRVLNLASLFLEGTLRSLAQLTTLVQVDLSDNDLSGGIPMGLTNNRKLASLDLSYNSELGGTLTTDLLRLPQLALLNLAGIGLTGIEDLQGATGLRPQVYLNYNYLDFAALERLYQGPRQPRVAGVRDASNQQAFAQVDTVGYEAGQDVVLTVQRAQGFYTYNYQWQRLVNGQWTNLAGQTQLTLPLSAVTASAQGTYRLVVHDRWFIADGNYEYFAPITLYSTQVYAKLRPTQPRNLPDDTNRGLALVTPPPASDAAAVKPVDMNYVRTWIPRVPLTASSPDPAATAQSQAQTTANQAQPGTLLYEHWANVYGPSDLDLLPLTHPADSQALTSFEAPTNLGNDYGARLRGYLLPPVTGDYTLYLSGDDLAQLWLSPDANPAHVALAASLPSYTYIREWNKYPQQRAQPVHLVAGQRYYVEVLHRQNGGGDGVAVAWVRPDQPGASPSDPIPGQYLAPAPLAAPAMAPNLVVNPSFDGDWLATPIPLGWSVTVGAGTDAHASYSEAYLDGHTGAYHGTHYTAAPGPYEVYTYQTLTNLAPGTYTLRAWLRSLDGHSTSELRARGYGGPARGVAAPAGSTDWVLVELPNLIVTTGRCELGIYSQATSGQSIFFDDLVFTRQDGGAAYVPTQAVALANPSFEADGQAVAAPQGWTVTPGANTYANACYVETYPGAHTGNFHATHYRPEAYEVYTHQTLTGLAAGSYTLRAWLRSGDGNSPSVLRARPDGGALQQAGLPAGASGWTLVEVPNIVVTNGQLEVGVYSNAAANQVLFFDDFTLERALPTQAPADSSSAAPSWTVLQAQTTTQYLDGLGRPVQTVLHQASPQRRDLVQPQAYDALGREPRQYLPFPADTTGGLTGSYRYRALSQQQQFYATTGGTGPPSPTDPTIGVARTGVAFAETRFEASPLNRVLAQGAAGEAWQLTDQPATGHFQQRLERPNLAADSVPTFQLSPAPRYLGAYPDGELWGTQTTDEHGGRSIEWKDKLGHLVLKQVETRPTGASPTAGSRWLRTAYVYDDFERLQVVVQPEGTKRIFAGAAPLTVAPFLFHYRYDGRGRQIAKQVPGQDGETVVVYDQLDRPVLSQDAQQRTRREWSWTKYDALGRIVMSGLVTRNDTLSQVSLQAVASADTATSHQYEQRSANAQPHYYTTDQAYPKLGQAGFSRGQVLSATYYDDYDFDNNGQPDLAYDPSTDGQFPSSTAPVADALRTQGLTTRTKTRVLGVAENDATQAAWLTTTTFYDERARPVQVQTTNARQGTDLLTTQLDFTGKVVQSVARHQGPNLATPLQVAEFFTYDHTGRLLSTRQQLPGEAHAALLDTVQYNELGQATRKTLATGRLKQEVDYTYNIRGWLTKLNDPFSPTASDLFNLSLHYETGFTKGYEQYNGNLTGQTWRGRDGVQRAYGYGYDPLNRLLQGDFVARAGGSVGTLTTATAWNTELDNYRLSFVSYDDNGNINTLRRQGLLKSATHNASKQYGAVDNLSYAYQGNRLQAVDDQVTGNQLAKPATYHGAPTSLAGDFQEAGIKLGQEYLYDANGNLSQDKNKGITGILYNHLNLPRQIHFGPVGDSVVFRYSASGQKVAKLVYQTGKPAQRTDYLGPYQYEQDSLKFFPHAEGRVLRFVQKDPAGQATVSYQREYTIKDHLGNLRLAYRAGQVRTLTATLEQDKTTHDREVQQFDSVSVSAPVAVQTPYAHGAGSWAARLNAGGSAPQPLGPLTQLGVQKGDMVTVTAFGLYPQATQHGFIFSLGSFLANLFHPAQAPAPGLEAQKRKGLPLLQVGVAAGLASLPQLSGGVPQGYLRLLVFDKDSALVANQPPPMQLTQAAHGGYEQLRLQLVLPQDGYVTAYVGNESDVDVYFDDMSVEHRPGLQVQETQYDPAGLELAGLAAPSPGIRGLNNYRFNGKEFQADLGLAWNHQDWRFFDPQILRWHVGDPEIENGQESWTPYSFGYDNAVRYADANGREPGPGDIFTSVVSFSNGLTASLANNFSGGIVNTRELQGRNIGRAQADNYNAGQKLGDGLSIVGGTLITAAAVVEAFGVGAGTILSGGTAAPGAIALTPGILAQAGYGAAVASRAYNNAKDENGRVNAQGKRPARRTADNTHGNKLGDQPAEGYSLRDADTGELQKYGETTVGEREHGVGNQKRYSAKRLESTNSVYQKELEGTKTEMHKWQTKQIRDYKANNGGQRPPLNKTDY